ncbi:toxin [Bacillus sp. B1-b2]|nr:toxin [Bacillus sp. B1-b2]
MIGVASILMGNSQLPDSGIYLNKMSTISIVSSAISKEAKKNLGNIIILPEEAFDQEEAAAIIERINRLPKSLLEKIELEGIKLKLFTGKLTDNETAKQYAGIIPRGYTSTKTWDDVPGIGGGRVVLVKIGASNKGMGHSSVNLEYHELAHSIDYKVFSKASNSKKYVEIWEEEKRKLFPNKSYFLDYKEEYFAETFAMFYVGGKEKEKLRNLAPKTYEYINSLK